jgi:pilus assembly protein Flp/PilA
LGARLGRKPHKAQNLDYRYLGSILERKADLLALWTKLTSWSPTDEGASMVEYALLVVLIAIIAIVAVSIAGRNVSKAFSTIAGSLAN